jgi:hypothetical protein
MRKKWCKEAVCGCGFLRGVFNGKIIALILCETHHVLPEGSYRDYLKRGEFDRLSREVRFRVFWTGVRKVLAFIHI